MAPLAALLLSACGRGDASPELLIDRLAAQRAAPLQPTSLDLAVGGAFAARQSAYANNLSPALAWAVTPGAQSYAVVIEDPDSRGGQPFVHWLIWNIPGDAVGMPEGVPLGGQVARPPGAAQGVSDAHTLGYFGPHPPAGTGLHHYVIELFALDERLGLAPGQPLPALEQAMKGHVLAKGRLVATAEAPR
ncbi:MAG: YbhB/YbcL family Raf kinase inhibitor-like protein [Proteobacteria bacterium]|nr:YbhB/YbcL family Raf kinase inhibitor-like protein [Pseudomonadota bacterium]